MATTESPTSFGSRARLNVRPEIFLTLDGLRGIAALVVVMWHAELLTGFRPGSGYLAVDLFFIMSGFVIAHSYDRRLADHMTARDFIIIRLIRLYPLYLIGAIIAGIGVLASFVLGARTNWTPESFLLSFSLSLLFLPTPLPMSANATLYPLNPPAWSLFFELFVNVLFGVFHRYLTTRVLLLIAIIAWAGLVWTTILYGSFNTGYVWPTAPSGFPRVFFSFSIGVLLQRAFRSGRISLNVGAAAPIALSLIILCVAPPPAFRAAYDFLATTAVFPLIMLAAVSSQPKKGAATIRFLGATSYAVYAVHLPLLLISVSFLTKILHVTPSYFQPWGGIAFAAFVLLSAWLLDRYYDTPTRLRITARLRPSRVSVANAP